MSLSASMPLETLTIRRTGALHERDDAHTPLRAEEVYLESP